MYWNDKQIKNCWVFEYLGSLFFPDAKHLSDVRRRIDMARTRAGKLRHTWAALTLPLQLKLRLYKAAVCSIMTYGSEAWLLDNATCKTLNGANAAMLAIITGKSIQQEACHSTTTFDILPWIRGKRLQWAGHILRLPPTRLLHRTLQHIHDQALPGDMLMDAPIGEWTELIKMAEDRKG